MSSPDASLVEENLLLARLARDDYRRLADSAQVVDLAQGTPIVEPGEATTHALFPLSGLISITLPMRDGKEAEIGIIGREGMFGTSLLLGTSRSPGRAVMQIEGRCVSVPAPALTELCSLAPSVRELLLRYVQAAGVQLMVNCACNGLHDINHRLARWLLMCHDRVGTATIPLTHEFIAQMLGVQRAGVTIALGAMQATGFISQQRGKIIVVDRAALESVSCECYEVATGEYVRLFGA